MDTKKKVYSDILKKLIYETELCDKSTLSNIVRQTKMMLMTAFSSSGNAYGVRRAFAYRDAAYAVREKLSGYEFYAKIRDIEANLDAELDSLIEKINGLRDRIFSKERLILSVAGEKDEAFERDIFFSLKCGDSKPKPTKIKPLGERDEGIAIPSRVGFGASVAKLSEIGKHVTGAMIVAETILNFEYLWCEVRVKGGAYGVSQRVGNDGGVSYSSFRDPTPDVSLEVFRLAPKFLREFSKSGADLKKYIIGAMGEFEPYVSAPLMASISTSHNLSGYSEEERARLRAEILACDESELLKTADTLELLHEKLLSLLVAPKEKINAKNVVYV
jgi:Zn-dependent M16 (insulinase) family peptidase